jgi:hypothetical protein
MLSPAHSSLRQRNLSPQPIQRRKPNNGLPPHLRIPPLHPLELLRHPRENIRRLEGREDLAGTDSGAAVETTHVNHKNVSFRPFDRSIDPFQCTTRIVVGYGLGIFVSLTANTPIPVSKTDPPSVMGPIRGRWDRRFRRSDGRRRHGIGLGFLLR